jgi:hypothetical protein
VYCSNGPPLRVSVAVAGTDTSASGWMAGESICVTVLLSAQTVAWKRHGAIRRMASRAGLHGPATFSRDTQPSVCGPDDGLELSERQNIHQSLLMALISKSGQ